MEITTKLQFGTRFIVESKEFEYNEAWEAKDVEREVNRENLIEKEMREVMNVVNRDISFTTELERDFPNCSLPTLTFEMRSTPGGISHLYDEKPT